LSQHSRNSSTSFSSASMKPACFVRVTDILNLQIWLCSGNLKPMHHSYGVSTVLATRHGYVMKAHLSILLQRYKLHPHIKVFPKIFHQCSAECV
jgi:ABC-type arginine transport system ATPase subunit